MGEHRTVDELVARVTNQAIEIERMRGELRSVKKERDLWIEVAADLGGQLGAALEEARRERNAHVAHEIGACAAKHRVMVDPGASDTQPRWSWWRRVFCGA